jgi:hypothetical protein
VFNPAPLSLGDDAAALGFGLCAVSVLEVSKLVRARARRSR